MDKQWSLFFIIFFIFILFAGIKLILQFYGISMNKVAVYLIFYVFLLLSFYMLPSKIEEL